MTVRSVEELVERLRTLTGGGGDGERLAKGTGDLLGDFDVDALPPEFCHRPEGSPRGRFMVHREGDFNITTVIWGPGERAEAHDHRTWGTILVVSNEIEESRFEVVGGERPQRTIEQTGIGRHRSGAVSTLYEGNEVHAMYNPTDVDTLEIHIYGDDLTGMQRSWWRADGGEDSLVSAAYQNC